MCVQHFHVDHAVHQLLGCVVMVMVEFCGHVCVCVRVYVCCYRLLFQRLHSNAELCMYMCACY